MNLLISSAGRRVALIESFREDAHALGIPLRIVATDMQPELSAACQVADASYRVSPVHSPDYLRELSAICRREEILRIIPTIDTELTLLSEQQTGIGGALPVISDVASVATCRDKAQTELVLRRGGIPTPRTVTISEYRAAPGCLSFPFIAKPRDGSRSIGVYHIHSEMELERNGLQPERYILQELLRGRECTVNCFVSQEGELIAAVPHERLEVRAGEVSKGRTLHHPALSEIAALIVRALPGLRGPFCFQAIIDEKDKPFVFEVNARFGGGYPLTHRAGAHFTRWILEEALQRRPLAPFHDWLTGVTMLRYDAALFHEKK